MDDSCDLVGIVPAAGKGSRISPLPSSKELFPVGFTDGVHQGTPRRYPKVVSQFLLEQLRQAGAKRAIITISPTKTDILQYYGDGSALQLPLAYVVQREAWGMPYAIDAAYPWLSSDSVSLFGMPDTVFGPANALEQLVSFHQQHQADITLALFPTTTPWHFGMVDIDARGTALQIVDKPPATELRYLWGAGCWNYRFSSLLHEALPTQRPTHEIVLGDLFQEALTRGLKVMGLPMEQGVYLDIGSPEGLQRVMEYSRQQEQVAGLFSTNSPSNPPYLSSEIPQK